MCVPQLCWLAPPPGQLSLARPGPACVMTESRWFAVTSCGSPASLMCHQQRRLTGAGPPVWSVSAEHTGWVCLWDGGRGTFQERRPPSERNLVEILGLPPPPPPTPPPPPSPPPPPPLQVPCGLRPRPGTPHTGTACSRIISFHYMCVHRTRRRCRRHHHGSHPCGHLPLPGSHTHYQSPLMASN